jgi:hypothetical protein
MEVAARQRTAAPRPDRRRASGGMIRGHGTGCKVGGELAEAGETMASKGNKAHGRTARVNAGRQRTAAARGPLRARATPRSRENGTGARAAVTRYGGSEVRVPIAQAVGRRVLRGV